MKNTTRATKTLASLAITQEIWQSGWLKIAKNLEFLAKKSLAQRVLDELYHTCLERKLSGDETTSYTAKLYKKAPNSYLKKIAEEACEFALAIKDFKAGAKGEHKETQPAYDIVYEGADVLFHMLVALAAISCATNAV